MHFCMFVIELASPGHTVQCVLMCVWVFAEFMRFTGEVLQGRLKGLGLDVGLLVVEVEENRGKGAAGP